MTVVMLCPLAVTVVVPGDAVSTECAGGGTGSSVAQCQALTPDILA